MYKVSAILVTILSFPEKQILQAEILYTKLFH